MYVSLELDHPHCTLIPELWHTNSVIEISAATGLAVNTVMKHINKLAERQYIAVERTSYIDHNGMKWNGNNLYTILPIRQAADAFYQRQLAELELAVAQQRARRKAEGPGSAFIPAGKGQGA